LVYESKVESYAGIVWQSTSPVTVWFRAGGL